LQWYQSSDQAERAFCGVCGSNLFWRRFNSRYISVFAGSFDRPTGLNMDTQIHVETKGDYYDLPNARIVDQEALK